jgi:hypothetical protein
MIFHWPGESPVRISMARAKGLLGKPLSSGWCVATPVVWPNEMIGCVVFDEEDLDRWDVFHGSGVGKVHGDGDQRL